MGSRRFRLTKTAKILILIIVLCVLGGGVFAAFKTGLVKNEPKKTDKETVVTDSMANSTTNDTKDTEKKNESVSTPTEDNNTINLSIDEWVGYATIIQANGGLTTQPGSIYDKLGIKVNVNIINDPTQSSNALIKGELDAAGYTINRLAFLSNKFLTPVILPLS